MPDSPLMKTSPWTLVAIFVVALALGGILYAAYSVDTSRAQTIKPSDPEKATTKQPTLMYRDLARFRMYCAAGYVLATTNGSDGHIIQVRDKDDKPLTCKEE